MLEGIPFGPYDGATFCQGDDEFKIVACEAPGVYTANYLTGSNGFYIDTSTPSEYCYVFDPSNPAISLGEHVIELCNNISGCCESITINVVGDIPFLIDDGLSFCSDDEAFNIVPCTDADIYTVSTLDLISMDEIDL